jgi:hypothetical protein
MFHCKVCDAKDVTIKELQSQIKRLEDSLVWERKEGYKNPPTPTGIQTAPQPFDVNKMFRFLEEEIKETEKKD